MKDKALERYKWYKVIITDSNPYNYRRHLMRLDKKDAKGKVYVLDLWSNSNHDGWQAAVNSLPEALFDREQFVESSEEIEQVFRRLQPVFLKKVFDPFAR